MIKVGIVGATGYAGNELVRILANHPEAEIKWLGSKSYENEKYSDIYRNMYEIVDDVCTNESLEKLTEDIDVLFTATPQGYLSGLLTDKVLEHTRIIDLSADFRLKDVNVYEKWYKIDHKRPDLLNKSVYGLCEINRELIKNTRLIANPGCYTTTSILTLYPMVKEGIIDTDTIVIDAKSGVTGAGRKANVANLFCEVNESMKAYGIASHRHTPEIEQELSNACGKDITLSFTPHLVPMNRGILATCYARLVKDVSENDIKEIYNEYYGNEKFIRILPEGVYPETRNVKGSNYIDIGFKKDDRTNRLIALGALDNIVKGAAGQAVQNMNIMFGLAEDSGLNLVPTIV